MSIFIALRDALLGTTPQRIVAQRLARIESVEADWQKIADTLRPLAIPPPFVNDTTGNAAFEAVRCLEARERGRIDMLDMVAMPKGEAAALNCGRFMGQNEAEARCRIAEWLAE